MRPSEVVILAVEDLLCSSSLVVVQYDFLVGHVPVVGQYAAVCILAVEEVKLLALLLTLPLYDETAVLHVLETLEGERSYIILLVANLHGGPARLPCMICSPLSVPLCRAALCPRLGRGYADAR